MYLQFTSLAGLVAPGLNESLLKGTIISTGNVHLLGADVFPYKMHLDATIHWCNLPAHFWRTNYCALVKQTIWNASLLNRACQGSRATPSPPHAAFVLLLLVLSCICLLSQIKAHQRRIERRLRSTQGSELVGMCFYTCIGSRPQTYMRLLCVKQLSISATTAYMFPYDELPAVRTAAWQEKAHSWCSVLTGQWCF